MIVTERANLLELASRLPAGFEFLARVQRFYSELMGFAGRGPDMDGGPGLGGQLFYAGKSDKDGSALLVAANVAGAASLAATADGAAQRQTIRDGAADFLVNSLDEALRILKNEVRRRATVAVCVGLATELVEREMKERGVAPDVWRSATGELSCLAGTAGTGSRWAGAEGERALLAWSVGDAPTLWLPKLDAIAVDCLAPWAKAEQRWLRRAPQYMGRLAQGRRLVACDRETAEGFVARVRERSTVAQMGALVEIHISAPGMCDHYRFAPRAD